MEVIRDNKMIRDKYVGQAQGHDLGEYQCNGPDKVNRRPPPGMEDVMSLMQHGAQTGYLMEGSVEGLVAELRAKVV